MRRRGGRETVRKHRKLIGSAKVGFFWYDICLSFDCFCLVDGRDGHNCIGRFG